MKKKTTEEKKTECMQNAEIGGYIPIRYRAATRKGQERWHFGFLLKKGETHCESGFRIVPFPAGTIWEKLEGSVR